MPLPYATTTVTVKRASRSNDGYDSDSTPTTITEGLRAGITGPSGSEVLTGGLRSEYVWVLNTDPADIQAGDQITDETNNETYVVQWAAARTGLGLDHVTGRLQLTKGAF